MHDQFHYSNGPLGKRRDSRVTPKDPGEVLIAKLTVAEKRALLASWASDARAVRDAPGLRKLDDGRTVEIDDILAALKQVDEIEDEEEGSLAALIPVRMRAVMSRRHDRRLKRKRPFRNFWRDDDDDDPPPCPAVIQPRPTGPLDYAAQAA